MQRQIPDRDGMAVVFDVVGFYSVGDLGLECVARGKEAER